MDIEKKQQNYEVIIIGAGPAGIGAALKLQKQNVPYVILEGRDRPGGRVLTCPIDGIPVDLGACWIHSYGKQNPLKPYVNNLKIKQAVLDKRKVGRMFLDGEEGKQFDETSMQVAYANNSYFFRATEMNTAKSQKDLSLYQAGKDFVQNHLCKCSPKEKRCIQLLINMTEHYQGSSIRELSTNNYEFRVDSGGDYMPECGYGETLKKIIESQKLNIVCKKMAVTVCYQEESVFVQCKDGSIYNGKKIISSIPLGVLKAGKIKFVPELPNQYQKSIKNLGMGLMNKIIVSFQQNFWGPVGWLSIGCDERGKFSQIYNLSQKGKHILCCFITDDFARKCQKLDNQIVIKQFLSLLSKIYGAEKVKMKQYLITAWGKEQYSMGSYSSFHIGSSPQDCYKLRTPINNTLWMIGQHCYAEHIGTAHGAFKTGEWAGEQVLKSLKWINPILKQPKHIKKKQ